MSGDTHTFETDLSQEDALALTKTALNNYVESFQQFNPKILWGQPGSGQENLAGFSFEALKGTKIRGALQVLNGNVTVQIKDIPIWLSPFRSQAINLIGQEIRKQIDSVTDS
jgi:hypothetical protein